MKIIFQFMLLMCSILLSNSEVIGQPGSYTVGLSFDLFDNSNKVSNTDSNYAYSWSKPTIEDLVFTPSFENCNNRYPSIKTHNHCIESHTDGKYEFTIIRNTIDSMIVKIEFDPFPMDNHYKIDSLPFHVGKFDVKINGPKKEVLKLDRYF